MYWLHMYMYKVLKSIHTIVQSFIKMIHISPYCILDMFMHAYQYIWGSDINFFSLALSISLLYV